MLKDFLYLDTESLSAYLSHLEGGVMGAIERKEKLGVNTRAKFDAKILSVEGKRVKR